MRNNIMHHQLQTLDSPSVITFSQKTTNASTSIFYRSKCTNRILQMHHQNPVVPPESGVHPQNPICTYSVVMDVDNKFLIQIATPMPQIMILCKRMGCIVSDNTSFHSKYSEWKFCGRRERVEVGKCCQDRVCNYTILNDFPCETIDYGRSRCWRA